ncbi:MAG: hypothetical protein ACOCYP_02155 [Planctomycetota bacterium]
MDIYFCDSCAARVSDADLKRGQGIRKADVTVCGSCVENGRGGDLLEAAAAASLSDEPQAEAAAAIPRQMPDTDALVRAGQEMFAREAAQTGVESEDDWPEPEAAEDFDEDDVSEPEPDPQYGNMAEAANSFSALGAGGGVPVDEDDVEFAEPGPDEPEPAPAVGEEVAVVPEDEAEAVEQTSDPLVAQDAAEPEPVGLFPEDDGDLPPQGNVDTVEIPIEEQPAATSDSSGSSSSRRARSSRRGSRAATTSRSGRQEEPRARAGRSATRSASKSDQRRSAAGAGANAKPGRGSSTRTSRSSSGRQSSQQRGSSTRTGTRTGGGKTKLDGTSMALLGVTGVALLVFVVVLVFWLNKPEHTPDNRPSDVTDRLQIEVSRIKREVVQALRGNDLAKLEHAHSLIKGDRLENAYQEVEKAAKAKGYTDEDVHNYPVMQDFSFLRSMERTLRDRIAQLKAQR